MIVKVLKMDHQGRGIAKVNDKTVFIYNTLPDEVVDIIDAEHNVYRYEEMYQRMEDTLDLLRRGVAQDKIKELLETQTEHIAMNFVRRGF